MEGMLESYIGIPYQHRGRTRQGIDCYGLVMLFYREMMKTELPDYREYYSNQWDRHECGTTIEGALHDGRWVPCRVDDLGAVHTFRVMGAVCHVGIVLKDGQFLHAFEGTNSCIERLDDMSWSKRRVTTYRWQTR